MKKARIIIALLVLLGAASLAEAQIIVSSTTASTTHIKAKKSREKCFFIRPEGAIGKLGGSLLLNLNSTFEYQYNPYFSVGGGTGYNFISETDWAGGYLAGLPLYANARIYFNDRNWSPFFNLKVGYHFKLNVNEKIDSPGRVLYYSLKGFIVSGTLGIQYKNFDFGVSGGLYNIHVVGNTMYPNSQMGIYTINIAYNIPLKKK